MNLQRLSPRPLASRLKASPTRVEAARQEGVSPRDTLINVAMGSGLALGTANLAAQVLSAGSLPAATATGALALGCGVAGWVAADLASGFFHHWVDNYPRPEDKVVGDLAYSFQVHHHKVTDMSEPPLGTNLAQMGQFSAIPMVLGALVNPPAAALAGLLGFTGAAYLLQGSHRWSHENNPPPLARKLEALGIIQSREDHMAHHRPPYKGNYCIVNGMWNPLLEKTHFWRGWEKLIYRCTGAEPKCWRDPAVKDFALGSIDEATMNRRVRENSKDFLKLDKRDFEQMQQVFLARHPEQAK